MTTCVVAGNAQNVVTEMRYGPGGQLVELIARNPVTGDQVTRYEYGVTLAESGIASNDLLRAEIYPDAADSLDRVTYTYNRQGQRTTMRDQNGSVHAYSYDLLGRQTADSVLTLASGVDDSVLHIGQSYEVRGMVEKITSYSDATGTTPVNEVQNAYNSFGQLVTQYQEHAGAVNTATTPKVQYVYVDGSANTIRSTSMVYPNGNVLAYLYDDAAANNLSRIRTLNWSGMDVCRYSYLGLGTFVVTDYLQPQVKLDYALGSGDNPYSGFDRFGRIIDLPWNKYGGGSSSSSSSNDDSAIVHLQYGYDRSSNRTHRADLVAESYGKNFDELYEYDGLQRLKKFHRGRLTNNDQVITNPTLQQSWQLDATGNWQNFTQNDPADATETLDQQRIANRVNEITEITRTVGANWVTPEYDRNGNSVIFPKPAAPTTAFTATWDAWNRMTAIQDGATTIANYGYDGQNWRITKVINGSIRHYLNTWNWQTIEERIDSDATPEQQHVWGLRYIDDLTLRDRDTDADGTLDERLYATQDANWNVVAISNLHGVVEERYDYAVYGDSDFLNGDYSPLLLSHEWHCLYTGRMFDLESESYYCRLRRYSSSLGTWLSRDPIGYFDRPNLYEYVNSAPLMGSDPMGLTPSLPEEGLCCDNCNCTIIPPGVPVVGLIPTPCDKANLGEIKVKQCFAECNGKPRVCKYLTCVKTRKWKCVLRRRGPFVVAPTWVEYYLYDSCDRTLIEKDEPKDDTPYIPPQPPRPKPIPKVP